MLKRISKAKFALAVYIRNQMSFPVSREFEMVRR